MRSDSYALLGAICAGASVFIGTFTIARAPSRVASRLGRRGKKRMDALARSAGWRSIEPLVRWLGVRVDRLLPDAVERRLDRQLLIAGDWLGLVPSEYVALTLLSGLVALAVGIVVGAALKLPVLAVGIAGYGLLTPYFRVSDAAATRQLTVSRRLPYAVDLLCLGMSAGLDFPAAVRQVVARSLPSDPLAEELEALLQLIQLGQTRRAALEALAERVPTEPVRELVQTIIQAEERGNPVANVLAIQAEVSRQRRTTLAEELAAKAGVKLIVPVALVLLSLLLLLAGPVVLDAISTMS